MWREAIRKWIKGDRGQGTGDGGRGSGVRRAAGGAREVGESPRRRFFRPRFEMLEGRRVMSTETWSGGDSNDSLWTSNDNWAGIGGAGAGDDLVFPASAARKTNTNDFDVNTSFNSLTFNGTGYVISGNQIILADGITNNPGAGTAPIFNPNILLSADQTFNSVSNHVELNGVVNLNGFRLTLDGAGDHRFDGQIVGANDLIVKNGSGTARFLARSPNAPDLSVSGGIAVIESGADFGGLGEIDGGTLIVNG